jgi:radical SAM protein with 4Fe4S-binding SPASM domain
MNRLDYFTETNLLSPVGGNLPEIVEIEPVHNCNFRCIMCHVPYEVELTKTAIDVDAIARSLTPEFAGRWAIVGASHEPAFHPRFTDLIAILTDAGMKIDLTTNGSLFSDKLIDQVRHGNFRNITVSFDGARKETYERIRQQANFDQVLRRVLALREAVGNDKTCWIINYTTLRSNIDEITEAVEMWDRYGFDHVGVIAMVLRHDVEILQNETLDPVVDQFRASVHAAAERIISGGLRITMSSSVVGEVKSAHPDALLPFNPRPYFQLRPHPDVLVPCSSPYAYVRITFHGQVMLCHRIWVGDINQETLTDIWNSNNAQAARAAVKTSTDTCNACDFYKFCLNAAAINPADPADQISDRLRQERIAQ